MKIICPECKNELDSSEYDVLSFGSNFECNRCGMTLKLVSMDNDVGQAEVVDEGK